MIFPTPGGSTVTASRGTIVVRQSPDGQLSGTIYGEALRGFYSPVQRVAVLMRGPAAAPIQAYVAQVSANGRSMSGRFYR